VSGIGLGLIGAGRIGTLHAEIAGTTKNCRIAAIYDADKQRARGLAQAVGGRVCDSVTDLLHDGAVGAVLICSPTDTHVEMTALAARAGKAIFCEKPIDLDIARVQGCLEVLTQHPVPFTVGFHRRFDPHHRALRNEIAKGRIGRIEQIRIVSRDPVAPPLEYIRRSGGIFRDMMIHDIDQCRWLLGEELVGVFAIGSVLTDPEITGTGDFDTATATFWAAGGASCTIQNSRRCSYGFDQRIEIFGEKGRLSLENVPLLQTTVFDEVGLIGATLPRHFPQRYQEAYRNQLAAFVEMVAKGTAPETGALDGLKALMLADGAARSARSKRAVAIAPDSGGVE
jgi:myo-inositol 2-dehydrogenase / D-chiro-inositol 1-dehydrogenase